MAYKRIAVITLAILVALAGTEALNLNLRESQMAKLEEKTLYCARQHNVNPIVLALVLKGHPLVSTANSEKCFLNCLLRVGKYVVDGVIKVDKVKSALVPVYGEEGVNEVLLVCNETTATNLCDRAYEVIQCGLLNGIHVNVF